MFSEEQSSEPRSRNDATLVALALAALMCFHFCANVWWLRADHHVVRTDEETHMLTAREYYDVLFEQEHANPVLKLIAVGEIAPGYPAHPPLLPILGALTVQAFSYTPDTIALTNTFVFVFALMGVFLLARSFMAPWHAVFTTFVVSMTPAIFASSRYFMTDFLAMAIATWAIYALVQSNGFRNTAWVFVFAVLNGLAILTRTPGFLYYFVPCCVVVVMGLSGVWRREPVEYSRWDGRVFRLWLLNCIMTLIVTVGIATPWYFHHLERFNQYWSLDHEAERGGPLASAFDVDNLREVEEARRRAAEALQPSAETETPVPSRPNTTEEPVEESPVEDGPPPEGGDEVEPEAVSVAAGAEPPAPRQTMNLPPLLKRFVYPPVPWNRYPMYIINNGMFLPLFLLAVIGLPVAFLARTFRSRAAFIILLWVLGAWVLQSVLLKDSTARYAIPFLPGLSIFAAIAVLALPWRGARALCCSLLAAGLVLQYGNLTVRAYGERSAAVIPVEVDETGAIARMGGKEVPLVDAWALSWYHDEGLVLYKDTLTLSNAYGRLAAPTPMSENYKDIIFRAMAQEEQKREALAALPGDYATYLQLNLRGMVFDQRHYWPGDNPYVTHDWLPEELPRRKFESLGLRYAPEPLLTKIDAADYLVYAIATSKPEEEARWMKLFEDRGFVRIKHFTMDRLGQVPERNYGVLARDISADVERIQSIEDFDRLSIDQLYQIAVSPAFAAMDTEAQVALRLRFEERIIARGISTYAITPAVAYQWAGASRQGENTYEFTFLFRVVDGIPEPLDLYFRGKPEDGYTGPLPEGTGSDGIQYWDFTPTPPTTEWDREGFPYVMLRHQVEAAPTSYSLELGLMDGGLRRGNPVRISAFDFREIE